MRDQRKINSKERKLYLRIGFGKVNLQVYRRRFLRARSGLLRQRCMRVNQSEYNFDLSLYIPVILVLYSTRFIDIKLCLFRKYFNIGSLLHVEYQY